MRRLALPVLVGLLVLTSCSGDDGGGSESSGDDDESSESEAVVDDDAGAMTQALSLVPDDDASAELVIVNDYAAAGEALDLDRPEAGASPEEIADWFVPITAGNEDLIGGLGYSNRFGNDLVEDEAWREELGWAPLDVDIAVDVQGQDGLGYYAFIGDFDPDEIEDTVTDEDNPWADELEVEEQNGTEYYTWGDDPTEFDPERISPARRLGQGGNMAVLDGAVLWAFETDVLEDGIDAATGEEDSLADNDELGALAEAMDEAGAVGAAFSANGHTFDDVIAFGEFEDTLTEGVPEDLSDQIEDEIEDVPALAPYEAFATGVTIGDDGPQMLVALLHDDEDAAEENVDNLETVIEEGESVRTNAPWSEMVRLDDTEVDGEILVATLDVDLPSQANLWLDILFTRDSLLYAN